MAAGAGLVRRGDGTSKPYIHKNVKRWFTLYFIPVIPMGRIGSYVQCGQCGGTYSEEVFSYNPEGDRQQIYLQLRGLLALVMLAGGNGEDPDEIRAICDVYHMFTDTPLAESTVRSDARDALARNVQLGDFARRVAEDLSYQGKTLFLRAAYQVLCAKGSPRPDADAVLGEIARSMQISPQQALAITRESR